MREVEREIISRRPEHSVDLALDRMTELVGLLGDPQRACPVIHVTGTNGKTSTARMIDALLRSRGLRTGRFTSPHLVSIRERICVDGAPVDAERFVAAYEEILPYVRLVDERHPGRDVLLRGADRDGLRDLRRHAGRRGGPRGRRGRQARLHQRRRRRGGGHHPDLDRPHQAARRHARGDRGGEGRHHQARRDRGAGAAAARRRRGAAAARGRGGRDGRAGRRGVRRAQPRARGRRSAAGPARPARLPTRTSSCRFSARTRRATRPARWLRSRRSPGSRTRTSTGLRDSTPTWSGRPSRRSPRPAGWRSSGAAPPSSSTPRTTRPGWPRPWPPSRSRSPSAT